MSVAQIRRHLPLFRNLVRREVRQRHKGSILGVGWNLVVPAILVATYTVIFKYLFRSSVPYYSVFLVTGIAAWAFFASGAQAAASSLVANANLVKKVRFPREIVPIAAIAANTVTATAMLAIAIVLSLIFPPGNPVTFVMLPVFLALLLVFTTGFGLVLSSLNVYLRDVEYLYGALLTPWFFLTPILFSFADLPQNIRDNGWALRVLHYLNPVTPFILGIQDAVFFKRWPALGDLAYSAVAAGVMLAIGIGLFRRLERDMAVEL
ncbi:MAG: ABC transporter permease [Actinobacteria bacterium]|nr:ABC transporter permease [Actinomycetota bacterium]